MRGKEEPLRVFPLILFPMGILAWRILALPGQHLWQDWIAILAMYASLSCVGARWRAWPTITVATVILLLGIYLHGQWPYTLVTLGRGP